DLAQGSETSESHPILGSFALKIIQTAFGSASESIWTNQVHSQLVQRFLHAAITQISSRDESSKLAALYAISSFESASSSGFHALMSAVGLLDAGRSIRGEETDLQAVCLRSIARVLNPCIALNGAIANTNAADTAEMEDRRR